MERSREFGEMVLLEFVVNAGSASVGDGRGEMERGSLVFSPAW